MGGREAAGELGIGCREAARKVGIGGQEKKGRKTGTAYSHHGVSKIGCYELLLTLCLSK